MCTILEPTVCRIWSYIISCRNQDYPGYNTVRIRRTALFQEIHLNSEVPLLRTGGQTSCTHLHVYSYLCSTFVKASSLSASSVGLIIFLLYNSLKASEGSKTASHCTRSQWRNASLIQEEEEEVINQTSKKVASPPEADFHSVIRWSCLSWGHTSGCRSLPSVRTEIYCSGPVRVLLVSASVCSNEVRRYCIVGN